MTSIPQLLEILKPKPCPYELIRLGGSEDGAYLIPADLTGVTACFSPGCANRKSFEDELTSLFDIRCHLLDFTSDADSFATPLIQGKQTFEKKWLDIDDGPATTTLSEWITNLEPHGDLLLQMDIEGAEYRNLANCPPKILTRFRIIVLEMHNLQVKDNPTGFLTSIGPVIKFLDEHFVSVHVHANNAGGKEYCPETGLDVPRVLEATFLRKDRFNIKTNHPMQPAMIPHPLDIERNSKTHPPLMLSKAWASSQERSLASQSRLNTIYAAHAGVCIDDLYKQLHAALHRIQDLERRLHNLNWISRLERFIKSFKNVFRQ